MKKFAASIGFCAVATPASAMSLVSLHVAPITLTSATTNLALVGATIAALAAVVAYRVARN